VEEQQRPIGITVLAGWGIVVGLWHLMLAMFAVAYSSSMVLISAFSGYMPAYAAAGASLQNLGADLLAAAGAILLLIGSFGLWTMQRWAYWVTFAGAGLALLVHILPGLQGS